MADLLTGLLALLLSFPASHDPGESPEERTVRMGVIAEAVAAETEQPPAGWKWGSAELAAGIVTVWRFESALDSRIHAGIAHPVWHSDRGRAKCMGQIHVSGLTPLHEWAALAGLDIEATRRCARATARHLTVHARRCGVLRGPLTALDRARILRGYGSGSSCTPNASSSRRAGRWARIAAKLRSRPAPSAYARASRL